MFGRSAAELCPSSSTSIGRPNNASARTVIAVVRHEWQQVGIEQRIIE